MTLLNWGWFLLAAQLGASGAAPPQVLSPEFKSAAPAKAGGKAEISVRFNLVKGFAINRTPPMTLKLTAPTGIKLEKTEFTAAAKDPKSQDEYYADLPEFRIPAVAAKAGSYSIPGTLTYFFCSKTDGYCSKQSIDIKVPFRAE